MRGEEEGRKGEVAGEEEGGKRREVEGRGGNVGEVATPDKGASPELVLKRVVGAFWCWQPSTPGFEGGDLSPVPPHLIKALHGKHVIDPRVQTYLVEESNTSLTGWTIHLLSGEEGEMREREGGRE